MSSKGTSTFILQRASAVVLLPFVIWFLWSLTAHAGEDYEGMRAWLGRPLNQIMLGLLVTIGAFHGRIGIGEIIDDYIHGGLNGVLKFVNLAAALAIVAVTWVSLISL